MTKKESNVAKDLARSEQERSFDYNELFNLKKKKQNVFGQVFKFLFMYYMYVYLIHLCDINRSRLNTPFDVPNIFIQ